MAALADALEELSADGELESEVVFCPRLEPLVEFDLRGKMNTSGDNDDGRESWQGEQGWSKWEGNRTHDAGMVKALEDLHLAPYALLVPLDHDLLVRNGLQCNIMHDIHCLGGVSMHRHMGGGRGDREDGCG